MYMILEYMAKGDLKSLLRDNRKTGGDTDGIYGNIAEGSKSLTPMQLINFAREVANGMAFLAEQKVKITKLLFKIQPNRTDIYLNITYLLRAINVLLRAINAYVVQAVCSPCSEGGRVAETFHPEIFGD